MHRPTIIERAYQLARSGPCANVQEIREQLIREQHEAVGAHLGGPTIGRHLRELCLARRKAEAAPGDER